MTDRLRSMSGVGPMPDPEEEALADEEPGTSERLPPEDADPRLDTPAHDETAATEQAEATRRRARAE